MSHPATSALVDPLARSAPRRVPSRRDFLRGAAPRRSVPAQKDDYWIHVHRRAMACRFEITLASAASIVFPKAIVRCSIAFDDYYEMYMGTKGTLIMNREQDALLFEEGSAASRSTAVETTPRTSGPAAQSSETMSGNTRQAAAPATQAIAGQANVRVRGSRIMIQRFCSAVRVGTPLSCGPDKAFDSARACIRANDAIKQKARLTI